MLYQVFERGWLSSNNILFFDDDGASLVDTGYCTHAEQTVQLIEAVLMREQAARNSSRYTLKRIINTHLHSDHCGGNAALLAAYPELEVIIPVGEADTVTRWDESRLSYRATGQQCPRFTHTSTLSPGQTLRLGGAEWQVHAAPGHDPLSLMLFEAENRTLISADALWQNGCGVIFPELKGEPGFEAAFATLKHIEALTPRLVIPGHGAAFADVQEAIDRATRRLHYLSVGPRRNAAHGLRVLLKYKLLQDHAIDEGRLLNWLQGLEYFQTIQRLYFSELSFMALANDTLSRLIEAKAAFKRSGSIINQ